MSGHPYDHLIRIVPMVKEKYLKNVPERIRCQYEKCKHYEPDLSPGTDTCIGCARSYLRMPDRYEPKAKPKT